MKNPWRRLKGVQIELLCIAIEGIRIERAREAEKNWFLFNFDVGKEDG